MTSTYSVNTEQQSHALYVVHYVRHYHVAYVFTLFDMQVLDITIPVDDHHLAVHSRTFNSMLIDGG
jgi:hypothetical protein